MSDKFDFFVCAGRRLRDVLDRRELGVIDGRRTRQDADHFGFRGQAVYAVHRSRQNYRNRGLVVIVVAVAVVVFVIHGRGRHRRSGR